MQFALLAKVLFSKATGIAILILLVLAALFFGYQHAKDVGHTEGEAAVHAKLDPYIRQLEGDLLHEKAVTQAARETAESQRDANAKAVKELTEANDKVLADATKKLNESEAKRKKAEAQYAKAKTYVTPAADARCVIPAGFVRLHDLAATNTTDPDRTAQGAAVPQGRSPDDDAASTVALSAVAGTVAENYATYYDVSARLQAWQTWYKDTYSNWEKAVAQQAAFTTTLPPPVH